MRLSAVIIAQNEERDLPGCLRSLAGLDCEIVVVDGGSTDRTREIAREAGAKLFERPFDDFASQKQAAVDLASGEWILSIDADERVSPELAAEIPSALDGAADAYDLPFEVRFLGKRLRFGGLGREHHIRLFRKSRGRFGGARLHEGVEISGPVARLRGRVVHEPYRDLNEYLEKAIVYTDRAARKRYDAGRRFTPLHHLLPVWEFFMRTVLKLGALDGFPGVAWAALSSFHSWLKYAKLRELERRERP